MDPAAWEVYVPRGLRPALLANPVWRDWIREYVVHVLRANPLRRNLVRTYTTHVYNVLWLELDCHTAADVLALQRSTLARAVLAANPAHAPQRRLCRVAVNHFLGGVVLRDHPPVAQRLNLRTKDLPTAGGGGDGHPAEYALSDCQSVPVRDHFTEAEMSAILTLPHLSLRDRLMLRIMSETGLRRRAMSWLLVDAVFDRSAGEALPQGRALEKGLVLRQFALSRDTRELLAAYIRDEHPGVHSRWLFPSPRGGHALPISPAAVNGVLLRACTAANIRGRHVHSHTQELDGMRPSVSWFWGAEVCGLSPDGRPESVGSRDQRSGCCSDPWIQDVAKWIGHRTVDTTFSVYWDEDVGTVAAGMHIPWL